MITDRAIDIVAEATRDLTTIVLLPITPKISAGQAQRMRQIAAQLRALAGEEANSGG